jgi:hypothetical protein
MSSMENRPEPIHARAVIQEDGAVWVIHGDKMVVSDSTHFVSQTITALRDAGHDCRTHVVIYGPSSNVAWNGSIEQHGHTPTAPY